MARRLPGVWLRWYILVMADPAGIIAANPTRIYREYLYREPDSLNSSIMFASTPYCLGEQRTRSNPPVRQYSTTSPDERQASTGAKAMSPAAERITDSQS